MLNRFSTAGTPARERSRHWEQVISGTYFPLDLTFREAERFDGELAVWQLGSASLSRLTTDALCYRRQRHHLLHERDQHYLVTVPTASDIAFKQCGSSIQCKPGGFILERSHEPYEFCYPEANDLWVLKLPDEMLAGRIRGPDRFCSMTFDAGSGAGGLFADMLQLIPQRFDTLTPEARGALAQQLADLLVLALKNDERALTSNGSTVREAHLSRIEGFVRQQLHNPELGPDMIAAGCGISTRYLHDLFRDTNQTLGQWIRDQRLTACRESLADPACGRTVAEIAYSWGFNDQAQFSRIFKAAFEMTPTEYRRRQRALQ